MVTVPDLAQVGQQSSRTATAPKFVIFVSAPDT